MLEATESGNQAVATAASKKPAERVFQIGDKFVVREEKPGGGFEKPRAFQLAERTDISTAPVSLGPEVPLHRHLIGMTYKTQEIEVRVMLEVRCLG